jgi:hypothetical protein
MKRLALLLATAFALAFSVISQAAVIVYTTSLSGPNESPVNNSPGTGSSTMFYDTAAHTLRVVVTFQGLQAGTTASHIHCCVAPPGTAGVATTTPTFPGFPLGVTAATYDHTLDLTSPTSWNPAFITANGGTPASAESTLAAGLAAGHAYLNVHTTAHPGGEIRGFITLAPPIGPDVASAIPTLTEGALALLAAALVLAGFVALRRRIR